ncbi:MAG TPA: endo-1,4-beta-xylanase [Tepidisphaeraceae bacterium]|jgi:GH35 family endo-1,4-beta-xylanase|nr:endo-1,4-beta-xylanase [Tepidisphaeraceae bacterium]
MFPEAASQPQQATLGYPTLPLERAPSRIVGRILWLEGAILLAIVQVLFAGYRMGVGNQTIQIPFLKQWANSQLYSNDPMVAGTLRDYPSFFFRGLAWLTQFTDVPLLYFILHLVTSFAVLMATYWLARTIFRDRAAGMIAAVLLFAGHQRALAGDEMYSMGFTHTWAVFPLAIFAMVFLYREWYWAAFALAGIIFNLHALTGAYLAVMFGFWAIFESRTLGWRKVGLLVGLFVFLSLPAIVLMAKHRQVFDAEWLNVTKIRSADHSFATSWWQIGTPDIPRFALLIAFGALSLSFRPRGRQLRKTLLMAAAVGILFLFGYVFSDLRPVPVVLRAQLFRASRLLLVLVFVHVAFSIASSWRMGWMSFNQRESEADPTPPISKGSAVLEMITAAFTLVCLAVPGFLPFWPMALVLAAAVALFNARLSWIQASIVGAALLVTLAAWRTIEFPVAGLGAGMTARSLLASWPHASGLFWIGLAAGIGIWVVARLQLDYWLRLAIVGLGLLVTGLLATASYASLVRDNLRADPWVAAQDWARQNTPPGSIFLTPDRPGGFRIHSERPVVCEWRDGTQAYFSANFGKQWWETLRKIRPDMLVDATGESFLDAGKSLDQLPDYKVLELARSLPSQPSYIVLPTIAKERNLKLVYQNVGENNKGGWSIYEAKAQFPPGVLDKDRWVEQERFLKEVALPNIEKYRKSDARIELVDADGRPLRGVDFKVKQTRQAFKWGCSLPFFEEVEGEPFTDYKPDPVTPQELERFLEIFNYTLIPYSSKWMYLEPEEGKRNFHELDKYVDWCVQHNIEMEFHYITGLLPPWMRSGRKTADEQEAILIRHAKDLVDRYGDRIKRWQVVNDSYLLRQTPPVFEFIRKSHPDLKLGVSHCTKFYSYGGNRSMDQLRGMDDVEWLQSQGVKVDYYGIHGHTPHGLWADVNTMYETFDTLAKQLGVRLEVTEFVLPLNQISGPVRRGMWTPELQAEFFEIYYTVCFSHPAVDGVNYWVLGQGLEHGTGLLDADNNFAPRPTFNILKELITKRWRTEFAGRSSNGAIAFRGFHGDFEVQVTLPDGKTAKGKFSVKPESGNQYRLKLNTAGAFEAVELK